MASVTREKNGRRTIQFIGADGKRRSIRLGKVSQRQAEAVKLRVEQLAAADISGHAPEAETSRWVANLDRTMSDKLAAVGLIPKKEHVSATLELFLEAYIAGRSDVKSSTATVWRRCKRHLTAFFGDTKPIRDITAGDAKDFRQYLMQEGLADNTTRRTIGIAKQFFEDAVDRGILQKNPFRHRDLPTATTGNKSRHHFVTRETAQQVIEACPDAQWRLLFALSRYGGLRCPSEHLSLRWGDVDWECQRITVKAPKTEHHEGKGMRIIPLIPELRTYLEEVFEQAEPGTEFVITRYRDMNANLRTQLERILGRAGVKTWPKLFHNLRASRETELAEDFPIHVVCEWMGNSQPVALKHYLQVTDDHYAEAVQNPVQQPHESRRKQPQPRPVSTHKTAGLQGVATSCDYLHGSQVGDEGLEPPTSTV